MLGSQTPAWQCKAHLTCRTRRASQVTLEPSVFFHVASGCLEAKGRVMMSWQLEKALGEGDPGTHLPFSLFPEGCSGHTCESQEPPHSQWPLKSASPSPAPNLTFSHHLSQIPTQLSPHYQTAVCW